MPPLNRREFLRSSALGLGALALGPLAGCRDRGSGGAAPRRPNLVYIISDELGTSYCSFAGDATAVMPNVEKLVSEGAWLRQAVSSSPVCAPYRATLMTGKYASSTGMVINELRLNPNQRCLGHVLRDAGYQRCYIGKWHLYANHAGDHDNVLHSFVPPGPHRLGFDDPFLGFNFHHIYYGEQSYYHRDTPEKIGYGEGVYEPDGQTDQAIRYIERHAGDVAPFAMVLSLGPPHPPWTPDNVPAEDVAVYADADIQLPPNWSDHADPYMDRFRDLWDHPAELEKDLLREKRIYYAMITSVDRDVGRLVKALEDAGVADDTIVVFTSDHGEMLGSHGRIQKMIFYEEAVRVPFVVRWPRRIPAGRTSDITFHSPDIMPTLLGLMDLSIPDGVEGTDCSGHLTGDGGPELPAALLQGMGHTYLWIDGFEWRALRDERYTYARYRHPRPEAPAELLFDNVQDPRQMHNLAGEPEHRERLEGYRKQLADRLEALGDSFEDCTWYQRWTDGDRNILRSATTEFGPMPEPTWPDGWEDEYRELKAKES